MKRLLDYDPVHQVSTYFETKDDEFFFSYEQDVSKLLDSNKAQANDDDKTKRGWKQDWWKYATVPAIVEIEWLNKYGVRLGDPNHQKKVFELLNHPDYRYLKTTDKVHTIKGE